MPTTFKFINHACFTLTHAGHTVIFDPYLDGSTQDINDLKVEYIFVSHGHFDHLGSAIELAKASDATIISTARSAELLVKPAQKTMLCIWAERTNSPLAKYVLL